MPVATKSSTLNKYAQPGTAPLTQPGTAITAYTVSSTFARNSITPRVVRQGGGGLITAVWGSISGSITQQTDLQNEFNGKQSSLGYTAEDQANKGTGTSLGTSNTVYPTQNAVKTYVDANAGVTGFNSNRHVGTIAYNTPVGLFTVPLANGSVVGMNFICTMNYGSGTLHGMDIAGLNIMSVNSNGTLYNNFNATPNSAYSIYNYDTAVSGTALGARLGSLSATLASGTMTVNWNTGTFNTGSPTTTTLDYVLINPMNLPITYL